MKDREYFGFSGWSGGEAWDTIAHQFSVQLGEEPKYVYAVYSTPAYEGSATVIYSDDGKKWFEVTGGHCSCYGLEDQWEPREIDPSVHLKALQVGKKELLVADTEGDYPEATQENFDQWLKDRAA
jgi:hypothetical protein